PLEESGGLKYKQSFTGSPESISKAKGAIKAQINIEVDFNNLHLTVDSVQAKSVGKLRKLSRFDYEEFSVLQVTKTQLDEEAELGDSNASTSTEVPQLDADDDFDNT